jgi:hypothetical protein
MATFEGTVVLHGEDIKKDFIVLKGDSAYLKIILTLIDPAYVLMPKITNDAFLKKIMSGNNLKIIKIALSKASIPKEVLVQILTFADIKKL